MPIQRCVKPSSGRAKWRRSWAISPGCNALCGGLHTYHLVRGDIAAGYRISQRVIALAGEPVDLGQRIQLHRPHGLTLLYLGRFEEARREVGGCGLALRRCATW